MKNLHLNYGKKFNEALLIGISWWNGKWGEKLEGGWDMNAV